MEMDGNGSCYGFGGPNHLEPPFWAVVYEGKILFFLFHGDADVVHMGCLLYQITGHDYTHGHIAKKCQHYDI